MTLQRTLRRAISCTGIGLHSGRKVSMTFRPAPAGHGIRFARTDLGGREIPASVDRLASMFYATGLATDDAAVDTVEHLLAAFSCYGIDNLTVELNHAEVPIMDGSAAPFVYLIEDAGIRRLAAPRQFLRVLRPVAVEQGDKQMAVYPADDFRVSYTISFDHPLLRHQSKTMVVSERSFAEEIAPARTFGFLKEIETLRQRGLTLGGSLENAVVLGDTGPLNALRFEDEFVRHKILDAIGDLALLGHPLLGHVVVHRGGHALHTALAARLLAEPDAWELVEQPEDAALVAGGVPVPVGSAN
jgi:UDP-3-O-[3-hydroxymyristoyl] N-acetylglucosamine deacetylase